tara:strand:+ start:660 stop:1580 length:921 start_codon:yes stop_codon:yes gene_type:complete
MNNNLNHLNDEIDLRELGQIIWQKKILIGILTTIFAFFSVVYSLYLPDIYKSSALLSPSSQDASASSSLGGLSGLASIAGVNLSSGNISKSQIAIKRIQSHEFFSTYFLPNINLENLMAVKQWQPQKNIILYDAKLFNTDTNTWVRNVSFPKKIKPSSQESFQKYREILNIDEDPDTGLVYISIKHESPYIAKKWIDIIIYNINECMREIDKEDAQNSINFLSDSIKTTNSQSIKLVFSKLMENQMQTLMLASSNDAYVFKKINSPIVAEEKSEPNRALICIMGTILGALFSVFVALITHLRKIVK